MRGKPLPLAYPDSVGKDAASRTGSASPNFEYLTTMNTLFLASPRLAAAVALGLGQACYSFSQQETVMARARADSHAPIGVMADHMHRGGESMLAYRRMEMRMEGHRRGGQDLSSEEVFDLGFAAAAESMDMSMDMLEFMYAPSDSVTLMLMANYVDMEMEMVANPHAPEPGHGHGHAPGGGSHGTSGWGDTSLSALIRGWEREGHRVHWTVGLSAPTGSVKESMDGVFQSYGMQLGSGTWDARLAATYAGFAERASWGAQVSGVARLQESGPSGFARGDVFEATAWGAWRFGQSLSVSGRVAFATEGDIEGHFDGAHSHAAPPDFQANYGGETGEIFLGINWLWTSGVLRGQRLALEVGAPVYQRLNGVGMKRESAAMIGWQRAW